MVYLWERIQGGPAEGFLPTKEFPSIPQCPPPSLEFLLFIRLNASPKLLEKQESSKRGHEARANFIALSLSKTFYYYGCACVHYAHVCADACACAHMEPRGRPVSCPVTLHFTLLRQGLSLTLELGLELVSPSEDPSDPPVSTHSRVGLTGMCSHS